MQDSPTQNAVQALTPDRLAAIEALRTLVKRLLTRRFDNAVDLVGSKDVPSLN